MGKRVILIIIGIVIVLGIGFAAGGYTGTWFGYRVAENKYCFDTRVFRRQSVTMAVEEMLGIKDFRSQTCQDKWVSLVVYPDTTDGFFLDVGSASGEVISNSKILEDRGWKGICIDPFPSDMENRSCALFEDVIFSRNGEKVEFRVAGDLGGIGAFMDRWKDHTEEAEVVEFTTVTLDEILERAGAPEFINYMSLDIEGAELEALKGLSLYRYRFGAITIEHNFEEPKRTEIRKLLEENGYTLVRNIQQDDWFLNNQLLAERGGLLASGRIPKRK